MLCILVWICLWWFAFLFWGWGFFFGGGEFIGLGFFFIFLVSSATFLLFLPLLRRQDFISNAGYRSDTAF